MSNVKKSIETMRRNSARFVVYGESQCELLRMLADSFEELDHRLTNLESKKALTLKEASGEGPAE